MQKKIVAVAVAGLSTAAFAQTNVTIYGVADVSGQGFTMSASKALNSDLNTNGAAAAGSVFSLQSNSSLIGFKGTEDLGNGLKALFQAETTLNLTGATASSSGGGIAQNTPNSVFSGLRDTFVALNNKLGTVKLGYNSTPFRNSLTSFDVMPGATGSGQIERQMGTMRFSAQSMGQGADQAAYEFGSSIRATSVAYAMPTLYGFDASIAYTGSNNNGSNNEVAANASNSASQASQAPIGVFGLNLGWTGYGVNVQGAFQQAKYNLTPDGSTPTMIETANAYTSYMVGTSYTGIPGLKVSAVYNRNTLGTNSVGNTGAAKLSNNQFWAGASYRMGNWEPRVSAVWNSDVSGSSDPAVSQLGSRQWTANLGYYLSKRTQVYGIVSNLNNSANQNFAFGLQQNRMLPTGGQNLFTYGAGLRTTF